MGRNNCLQELRKFLIIAQNTTCSECGKTGSCAFDHMPPTTPAPYQFTTYGWVIVDTKETVKSRAVMRHPVGGMPLFFADKGAAEVKINQFAREGLVAIEARLSCDIPKNILPS